MLRRLCMSSLFLFLCFLSLSHFTPFTTVVFASGSPTLTLSNTSIPVNGAVDVTVSDAQSPTNSKDWIGLCKESAVPQSSTLIWWSYLLDVGVTDGNGSFTFHPSDIASNKQSMYVAGERYKFILAYNNNYTVIDSISFAATASQNPTIQSFSPVILNTSVGTAPQLPATVTAQYSNQTSGSVNVTWNNVDPSLYAQAGSFTVKGFVPQTGVVPKASVTVLEGSGPLLRFEAISDTHIKTTDDSDIYTSHLKTALHDINQIAPNSNALMVVGDITNAGTSAQYDAFNTILNSVPHTTPYFALGNHDTFGYVSYQSMKDTFLTKTGMPGVHYDTWINGYHFIVLGTDSLSLNKIDISATQQQWLKTKLAENSSPDKPIFLFMHQPLSNTVAGSDEMQDVKQDNQIKVILSQYPQTVVFSGHTHYIATSPNQFYSQRYCYMANTASSAYLWYGPTYSQPGTGSQGLYVDVYDDKVVVKGRDYTRQEWIAQETFSFPNSVLAPYMTTNKTAYAKNESITVHFNNGPKDPKDWIGIYKSTDTPGSVTSTKWLYVNGSQTATSGIGTGSVTFSGLSTAGFYKALFLENDGYDLICNEVYFTVN
ncbi:MAG TPA: metallophosphoesterase [Clostridiales bacterium]|nr:metallophosphoesterase [Clostridiales bacterium]